MPELDSPNVPDLPNSAHDSSTKNVPPDMLSIRLQRLFRLESIITFILVVAALKAGESIILPLVFALFLVALFLPLQRWLQKHMRRALAVGLNMLLLTAAVVCLVSIVWVSLRAVMEHIPQYRQELQEYARLAESYGVNLPFFGGDAESAAEDNAFQLEPEMLVEVLESVLNLGGLAALISSYLLLTLLGFDDYARRVRQVLAQHQGTRWLEVGQLASDDFQRYVGVRSILALLNGATTGIAVGLIGVDFAMIWGLLAFLLSYIPILGSIVALILTSLFTLLQFEQWQRAALTLGALTAIRFVLGNYVDPLIQGKLLKPTAMAVLLSVTFWGWLWGIAGAFIGVPLTILLIIICRQLQSTRWIAMLLSDVEEP